MEAVRIKLLNDKLGYDITSFAHKGDAGFDLRANIEKEQWCVPRTPYKIPTGVAMAIPEGFCGLVKSRSGLGCSFGFNVVAGVVDAPYRGEICVLFTVNSAMLLKPGQRFAQMIFTEVLTNIEFVDELDDTARGTDGFGSTGE